jgi:hypothetical protein
VATHTESSSKSDRLDLDDAKATRNLRHGLISLAVLIAMAVGLFLAVPSLHDVAHEVLHMPPGWVALAIGLEVLSCVGYVVCFLQVFDRAPIRLGARVALSELAFGAAVALGGAGSVAVGAWLLIERGARPGPVAERSAVLFLLTSAINLITLALAGLGLWTQVLPGKHDPLLSLLPGGVGVVVFVGFLVLPWVTDRTLGARPCGRIGTWSRATSETIRDTRKLLFSADWRLLGAFGYLRFDDDRPGLPDRLPLEPDTDPRRDRRPGRQLRRHARVVRCKRHDRDVGHDRLPRDLIVGAGDLGYGRIPAAAAQPEPARQMEAATGRASGIV